MLLLNMLLTAVRGLDDQEAHFGVGDRGDTIVVVGVE